MQSKAEWVNFQEILEHYELLEELERKEDKLVVSVPFMIKNTTIRTPFA